MFSAYKQLVPEILIDTEDATQRRMCAQQLATETRPFYKDYVNSLLLDVVSEDHSAE